ncbi:hypothetical protein EJ02DRAFT_423930 [Clathrospora elynae]|uniref:Uncharacterized protein n=1 Tax=Clathrospora elynae TaxID=706981 RepID=A0A6A5SK17_9PLEO|nr:hypothetical protein EJ02DRAFT_423930 [Clathrospora elynae]
MGAPKSSADPAHVVHALIYTLLDVFDATRDLHQTLTIKEQRDYEQSLRSKGYPASRRIEYVKDERLGSDEDIVMDKAAVMRRFVDGVHALGAEFAEGDVLAHTALQSEIITLQRLLVKIFLYGPTSTDPISHQLAEINAVSRSVGVASVDILAALQRRQEAARPPTPRSTHAPSAHSSLKHAPPYPVIATGTSSTSTVLMKYDEPRSRASHVRSASPVNTTVLEWRERLKPERADTDTDTTSMTGPTSSHGMHSASHDLYCVYAIDLQRDATRPLSSSITSEPSPFCPDCKGSLHLSPGKAWEISKWDEDCARTFQVQARFVAKCHCDGPDGQYACVICDKYAPAITVCGDVKALIKHLFEDHNIRELKHEEDIVEIIEKPVSRRDSGIGYGSSSRSGKSASMASSRRRKSLPAYEREGDVFDMRSSRR